MPKKTRNRSRSPMGAETPKSRRRDSGKSSAMSRDSSYSSILSENPYQPLQGTENSQKANIEKENKQKSSGSQIKSSGNPNGKSSNTQKNSINGKTVKPIVFNMKGHKFEKIKEEISKVELKNGYTLKKNFEGNLQIQTKCVEDKNEILKRLKDQNSVNNNNEFQFYTYTENADKYKTFVLKGYIFMKLDELLENLKENEIPVAKVN